MQAQQVIGARFCAAQQLIVFQGIDTDLVTGAMQGLHGLFQVRERRIRQAADVNHVGPVSFISRGLSQDSVNTDLRRFHYLRENADTVFIQADRRRCASEKYGQVLNVHSAPLHRHAQRLAQGVQVTLAQPRNNDSVHSVKLMQPATNHLCRHQCGDTYADFSYLISKLHRLHSLQDTPQALFRKFAGQKEDVLGHVCVMYPQITQINADNKNIKAGKSFNHGEHRVHRIIHPQNLCGLCALCGRKNSHYWFI